MYTDYTEENENETYYDDEGKNQDSQEKFKKIIIFIGVGIVILVLILIMAKGCTNKNNKKTTTPVVALGMKNVSLGIGETYAMQVDVLYTKNNSPKIVWESENSLVASVDEEGFIKGETEGTTIIKATYVENNKTYTDTCEVVVGIKEAKLEGITLKQSELSLKVGDKVVIELTAVPSDASVAGLIFESSNQEVATVDEKGSISGISEGTSKITIRNEDSSISSSLDVIVIKADDELKEPTEIKILGLSEELAIAKTVELIYDMVPTDSNASTITWTSSNPDIAKVELQEDKVVVIGVSMGKCTITATTSNNVTATIEVEITSDVIEPTDISIVGSAEITMKRKIVNGQEKGETRFVSYTLTPENVTNKEVSFKSSNSKVVAVNSKGIMAAVSEGTATITLTTSNGKTAELKVTVVLEK